MTQPFRLHLVYEHVASANTAPLQYATYLNKYGWPRLPAPPARDLKGMAKIMVNPGETRPFEFTLAPDAFAYGSTHKHDWLTDAGSTLNIEVGHSVRDIKLRPNITLQ